MSNTTESTVTTTVESLKSSALATVLDSFPTTITVEGFGSNSSFLLNVFWLFVKIFNLVIRLINWGLLHIPLVLFNSLQYHLEISLTLSSMLGVVGVIVGACYLVVRYKFLNVYSKSTETKHHTDVNRIVDQLNPKSIEKKRNVSYLDEFLSAIKIFGYLEKPVFNELTKSMTTQKLSREEILYLDESLGFSIVVEGVVQVYTKTDNGQTEEDYTFNNELNYEKDDALFIGNQRYQLLNEVKSGAPLSSLISTLDLFKNNNKELPFESFLKSSSSSISSIAEAEEYPTIVARPKPTDVGGGATIAIIPRLAFQRVHNKYPKATSHIVTMVLTRVYKVTMSTIHNYLGLTNEIIASEILLNNNDTQQNLPRYLYEGVVGKFYRTEKSSFLSTTSLNKRSPKTAKTKQLKPVLDRSSSRYVLLDSRSKSTHPGDLLSSVPISRRADYYQSHLAQSLALVNPRSVSSSKPVDDWSFTNGFEETEETSLRHAIVENMFKLLGIHEASVLLNNTHASPGSLSDESSSVGLSRLMNEDRNQSKFYNTINHAQLNIPVSPMLSPSPNPGVQGINFSKIKNDFAKTLTIKYYAPDTTLVEQGVFNSGLFFIIDGTVDVLLKGTTTKKLYTVKQGGLAGYLTSIVGFKSLVTIRSPKEKGVIVAHLSRNDYTRLMDKYYFLLLPVATKLKSLLLNQILTIDFALEWCHIPAGEVLCAQGDLANGFHIVLSGRFRVVQNKLLLEKEYEVENFNEVANEATDKKDEIEILGEYGHGESIGEVEVLTASRRTSSLIAVRDSETARIPRTLFEMLSLQNPSLMVKISRIVASEVTGKNMNKYQSFIPSTTNEYISNEYKTITILPCNSGLPVREFADRLVQSLKAIGRNVIALDQASTLTHLGRHAFNERLAQLKLSGYFAYLEEQYETIVYVCDTPLKLSWTSTCISQGDCILLLADAEDDVVATGVGDYEVLLNKLKTTARTDLCLIHQDKYVVSGSTSIWLKNRTWVQGHHHIQLEIPTVTPRKEKRSNIISELAAKLSRKTNPHIMIFDNVRTRAISSFFSRNNKAQKVSFKSAHKSDFLRLARILSNEAVGLVLGGGGSRGISHVGVVTALEKHGIPVDLIGGTSIGSFVGGLYAKEYNIVSIYGRAKKFSKRVASLWRSLFDLTYPVTSYITGYEFNRGIWKVFGTSEIEDFWIKYYCNSTNITNSTMDIHETGYSWRFIRALMSLAGLLPPIAFKGCMLLDGGYLDNLPVTEMKKKGAKYIIAVDVGSADDRTPMNYGDTLSGFWVLFNRWNPFSSHPNPPNMMDIQMRLAYVASVHALNLAKKTPGVIYLRPPIDNYATLDFGKFDEIYHVGFAYADSLFTKWEQNGKFPQIAGMKDKLNKSGQERIALDRRNSI